jgi:hypothetical protein
MGISVHNAWYSGDLEKLVREQGDRDISDWADMVSTSGYDNDGSTGPEMLDSGIGLARAAMAYHPTAEIFWAIVDGTAYYQYGKSEADALRRLRTDLASE